MSTHRCSVLRMTSPHFLSFSSSAQGSPEICLPTIQLAICLTLVSSVLASWMTLPSLRTTSLSHRSMISWSLWEMNFMEMPWAASFFRASISTVASDSARTAVGSSRTRSLVFCLSISRAISVNCLCPTGISLMRVSWASATPRVSMALSALFCMSCLSSVLNLSPKTSTSGLYFIDSLLRRMFSVAVNPGISENSWWTIPIPASSASKGSLNDFSSPSINIFPSYPPVSWITDMPKRMFIRVDLPAPFSPTRPIISPGISEKLTSERTLFPKNSLPMFSIFRSGTPSGIRFTSFS